jgi:NAD(P)-dependent dehydrogenase (short-subunit alcohol dehydrogenase family)
MTDVTHTVLVAGASRGLDYELIRQYAEQGHQVIAGCRTPKSAEALQALTDHLDATVHQLDVGSDNSVKRFATAVGDQPIDIAVIAAGVPGGERQSFRGFDFDDLSDTLNVNASGPVRVAQVLASNLAKTRQAKLIAITSEMGSISQTISTEMMGYRISKAALNEAWKCVSIEMEKAGVIAMVIHPGWVATDMGGTQAPLSPQQSVQGIRQIIASLVPDDSGTFRSIDGKTISW